MSRRRREELDEFPDPDPVPDPDDPDDADDPDVPDEDDVEYLLDPEEDDSVRTSVPNCLLSSHSCSSAPSTFVVVSEARSAPHISHWGIHAILCHRG
jgi:hypothetical protein